MTVELKNLSTDLLELRLVDLDGDPTFEEYVYGKDYWEDGRLYTGWWVSTGPDAEGEVDPFDDAAAIEAELIARGWM